MTEAKDPDKKDAAPEPKTGPETSKAEPKEEKAETPASDEAAQSTDNSETSSKSEFEDALALDRRLGDFLLSLGFFTRLPVPMDEETAARPLSDAAWAFPVIGTIIGIVGGLIAALAAGLPALAAGLIAIGAMACLSGALHEDGLADCADGLWSGESAEARLAIMRDSRIGAFGVIALVIFIGLKASAIAQLLTIGGVWAAALAIVAAAAASRGLLPITMSVLPLAGKTGRAAEAGQPDKQDMIASAGLAVLIALLTIGFVPSVFGLVAGGVFAAALGYLAVKRIDGYNGDVLGAQQQILETAILLAAAAAI